MAPTLTRRPSPLSYLPSPCPPALPQVADFPPDETSLMGAGIGYAQAPPLPCQRHVVTAWASLKAGLLPIVEMPYAKYLDCGADMFMEAAIGNWLSNGQCPNGMVVRLQAFQPRPSSRTRSSPLTWGVAGL
jgi:pyruvate/2-oxoglutarate/acetoin dehydrogenase E1 component